MNSKAAFAVSRKFAAVCLTFIVGLSSAHAYVLDNLIGSINSPNSGDSTELAAIKAASHNSSLTQLAKVDATSGTALPNPGTSDQFYIDVGSQQPLYFLLKFGTGGTSSQQDTFLFQNIDGLNKLVFSDSQVNFLSGGSCGAHNNDACNIGRLSHYDTFGSIGSIGGVGTAGGTVPEPTTIALFGLGLLSIAALRRKSAKNKDS